MYLPKQIKDLVAAGYERVGSDVYWELTNSYHKPFAETQAEFDGTILSQYIKPVYLNAALHKLENHLVGMHGTLYRKKLSVERQGAIDDPSHYYLSFFTRKINDPKSSFEEKFKVSVWMDEWQNLGCDILECDRAWLVQDKDRIIELVKGYFLIDKSSLQKALAEMCNCYGYRYNTHGGYYFIPHCYTNEIYAVKDIFNQNNLFLNIAPRIGGCDEDVEGVVRIIGAEFRSVIANFDKQLFEVGVKTYKKTEDWHEFKLAAKRKDISALHTNFIAKSRYGASLIKKIEIISKNSGDVEYAMLTKQLLASVNIRNNKNIQGLRVSVEQVQQAINKIDATVGNSALLGKWRFHLLSSLGNANQLLTAISARLHEEIQQLII